MLVVEDRLMKELREKYADLLLKKCVYSKNKSLFISYDRTNIEFIKILIHRAKQLGFKNILVDEKDIVLEHKLLDELSISEIKFHPYFYNNIWDQAIQEKCAFLLASTEFPNYFDDIDDDKRIVANESKNKSRINYLKRVMNDSISWTIFVLPNKLWANNLFPNDSNSYEKLENLIYSFCMIENYNPIKKWNQYINIENKKTSYLNQLNIKELMFKNSLGTNIAIGLAKNYIFKTLDNNHCIENMPTYSIWTAPHKYNAEGIIYGSMPITYQNYNIVEYWFKLSRGKIIDYDAKVGKQYLDHFFSKGDSYMRLGEIALVDFDSPISRTNKTYKNNLFDENVSTHLAFGCAYQNTIQNGKDMDEDELDKNGCNVCPEHMDFTIGTNDLQIIAKTHDNKEFELFKNGSFNYELINASSPFINRK